MIMIIKEIEKLFINSILIVIFNVRYEIYMSMGMLGGILIIGNIIFKYIMQPYRDKELSNYDIIISFGLVLSIIFGIFNKMFLQHQ